MAFKHEAWAFTLTLKHTDDIRSTRFHLLHDYIKSHLLQKMGKKNGHLLLVSPFTLSPDTWNPDEILCELDEFFFLDSF
jgi:hypothetical protein